MPGSGESHWNKVKSATEDSTFAWSEWQKVVAIPRIPSSTPLATKITMGAISLPIVFLPELVMNSTLAWLYSSRETSQEKSSTNTMQKWRVSIWGSSWMGIHLSSEIEAKMDVLKAHHSTQRLLVGVVVTSCRKSRRH